MSSKPFSIDRRGRQSGQAILVAVLFLTIVSVIVIGGLVSPTVRSLNQANQFVGSRSSYYAAEGVLEDVIYRLKNSLQTPVSGSLVLNGGTVNFEVTDGVGQNKIIEVVGVVNNLYRRIEADLTVGGTGNAFFYGIQAGNGGLVMGGNATINGNVYANGTITGAGYGNGGSVIKGTAVSAGSAGKIKSVYATSTAYAHTIETAKVGGDAYYTTITGSTVVGASHPNSTDRATTSFPITDDTIAEWEADAAASQTITTPCPYNLSGTVSIGPAKINCNVTTSNNTIVNLTGNLWIKGTFTPGNNTIFRVSPSLSGQTATLIIDDPADRSAASKITISNNVAFQGHGTSSYVMVIAMNNSAETGGSVVAIDVANNDAGDYIAYAPHGLIDIKNNTHLVEATGYKINLANNVLIDYETGLSSLLFTSGPSAGFQINSWAETP